MADICYTDSRRIDAGVLLGASLNVEWGDSGNDFELSVDISSPVRLDDGALVYVEGTEWGGVVDAREASATDGLMRYTGRSWHGVLRDRILCPDAGADYLSVSGEANSVLLSLVSRMGLGEVMTVSAVQSGISVRHQFDRYTDAYSGIRAMLAASGARLGISYDSRAGRAVLSAVKVADWSDGPTSDTADVDVKRVSRPYNHLICLGSGELRNRVVQHWYADAEGRVSSKQSLFGIDERATVYDYTNASAEQLSQDGPKKLAEYQTADVLEATLGFDGSYAVGDVVPGVDEDTGTEVSVTVGTVDVTVTADGVTATYRAGGTAASGSSASSAESSGGGASYTAGDGISIVGRTIYADVTQAKLDAVSATAAKASSEVTGVATDLSREAEARRAADEEIASDVASRVSSVKASGPLTAQTDESMAVVVAHDVSGVAPGSYGPAADSEPSFGGKVTLGPRISVDSRGHVTAAQGRSLTIPAATATESAAGLMSAADKRALDAAPTAYQPAGDYAAASHVHDASDVETGVLPVERGGTGDATGNARSASRLQRARKVTLEGAVTGSTYFDGSSDVTITCEGQGAAAGFLAAHPVGSVFESTSAVSPAGSYGGTWRRVPSLGPFRWERTA